MATETNIINDLSTFTAIPIKLLTKLTHYEALCIGQAIKEALATQQEVLVLNIGLGTLSINLLDMQCKFIPSSELKTIIKQSISGKLNPLEAEVEQSIIDKILKLCTEVI